MFRKIKCYFIILLILSLSFVPSVNASSDIFDEPRHVDYETYKQRMVEYIETPDYLKASMPPIVGRNEYVDSGDILLAVDDLLNVIPVINNDTFNQVTKTAFFKNANTMVVESMHDVMRTVELPVDGVEPFLTPYFDNPGLSTEVSMWKNYNRIAHRMQDIISDTLLLEESGVNNNFINFGDVRYITLADGNKVSVKDFFNRIKTAKILPDGYYHLTDLSPTLNCPAPPETIAVESVAFYCEQLMVVVKPGSEELTKINNALVAAGKQPIPTNIEPLPFKNSEGGRYPEFFMDKRGDNANIINRNPESKNSIITNGLALDSEGKKVVIEHSRVKSNNEQLGLFVNDGKIMVDKLVPEKQFDNTLGVIEGGFMFIFAVITLILAFVYR